MDTEKNNPLHDRVIVQKSRRRRQKQKGDINIPDTAKEKPQVCKDYCHRSRGKFWKPEPRTKLDVKVGDKILLGEYSRFKSRSIAKNL